MLEQLARLVMQHRRLVVAGWIALTVFGAYSAARVSTRWLEQFSIPGYSAYEANQRVSDHAPAGSTFASRPPHQRRAGDA